MKRLPNRAFTLIELLVVISIIAILAGLSLPAITSAMTKGQLIQTVNNGRQIQQMAMQAALEATTTGDTTIIGWPGNTNSTYTTPNLNKWVQTLTNSSVSGSTMAKLFSAPGVQVSWTDGTGLSQSAFYVYSVTDTSASDTIFLSTANWKAGSQGTNGNPTVNSNASPYGMKGFVVVRQGGDALQYGSKQMTNAMSFFGTGATNINSAPSAN